MVVLTELCLSKGNAGLILPGGRAQGSDLHERVRDPMTPAGHPVNLRKKKKSLSFVFTNKTKSTLCFGKKPQQQHNPTFFSIQHNIEIE